MATPVRRGFGTDQQTTSDPHLARALLSQIVISRSANAVSATLLHRSGRLAWGAGRRRKAAPSLILERLAQTLRFAAAAQEAVQQSERPAGQKKARAGQQRASQAPEIVPAVASEPAPEITRGAERAAGGIFGGFA